MPGSNSQFSNARCLVIGGGGFIGVNLSNALVRSGAQVHAFGRRIVVPGSLDAGVKWTGAEIGDKRTLTEAVANADYVFHLASSSTPSSSNEDPIADLTENVVTALGLLEVCRKHPGKRVVFISSGGTIYGVPAQVPTPETAPTDPISAYAVQKLAIEKYFALYGHLYGLDYVILRVANPYGPLQLAHRNQGVVSAFIQRALSGQPLEIWGNGEVVRDFLYIDDVTKAVMLAALYRGPLRLFNVGSGKGLSINTVIDAIERIIGRRLDRVYKPTRPADIAVSVLDASRIHEATGWAPETEWHEGLHRTIAWMNDFVHAS